MYLHDKTESGKYNSRKYDYQELEKSKADPNMRQKAEEAQQTIKNESGKIRSMRESLIKAHRDGNHAEIRDIQEYVQSHKDYKNE